MTRPPVTVVMPFAGSLPAGQRALQSLRELDVEPGDELILADNGESLRDSLAGSFREPGGDGEPAVTVVRAAGERSPAHARNVGAEHAGTDWILFLDADCRALPGLIATYFAEPIAPEVGAVAGEVVPGPDAVTFAARYGASRSFLRQGVHLAHPYLPRAVAANLLVRRRAFEQVGGFYEGVRAAEDTDFSWRLQRAGWRLEACPGARVEHSYRTSVAGLRRQWRGYAAGRAWLGRRYEGFEPEPALVRAGARVLRVLGRRRGNSPSRFTRGPASAAPHRLERGGFLALDALLGVEELAGFALSNRPAGARDGDGGVRVVLVANRFPALGDPLGDFALTLAGARVEAAARPETVAREVARELTVDYREDDGAAARSAAMARLFVRHPLRCTVDALVRRPSEPTLVALAPAVLRLVHDRDARVHPLGGDGTEAVARRLATLAGRSLQDPDG